jgi:hypothetical protein
MLKKQKEKENEKGKWRGNFKLPSGSREQVDVAAQNSDIATLTALA